MPSYLIGVYQEQFGTIVIQGANEELVAEKAEELLKEYDNISNIPTFSEHSKDRGVAIDVSEPDELRLAVTEIINDS